MKAHNPDFVVSLGDLGESKDCTESKQLYAGTTECFKLVREYFDGFGVPFDVVGGNHDLEGIDEFNTDAENLEAYLHHLGKETPYFKHEIAPKTLIVGLGSTTTAAPARRRSASSRRSASRRRSRAGSTATS